MVMLRNVMGVVPSPFHTVHSEKYADDYDKVQEKAWFCHNKDT